MTREEAINRIKDHMKVHHIGEYPHIRLKEALDMALTALRPVSREQVEKMRGEWIDIDGEKVPVDKHGQPFGWAQCSACGEYLTASDEYPCIGHFCPNCGAPMTDEAVEMVMKRMETIR